MGNCIDREITIKDMRYYIIPVVNKIRKELSIKYDVFNENSDNYNYLRLCDEAHNMLVKEIIMFNDRYKTSFEVIHFHGEQKHSPRINPSDWVYEHTWSGIVKGNDILYIDITSQQFKFLYDDIPDYYISFKSPKWYYADKDNILFSNYCKNEKVGKFVRIMQYYVWGCICKIIREL